MNFGDLEAVVSLIHRQGVRIPSPANETVLKAGDVVVLLGNQLSVAAAEIRLLQG